MPAVAAPANPDDSSKSQNKGFFPITHWTLIAAIRDPDNPQADVALQELCKTYLPAIEKYLRWFRSVPGDAHELANEFLAQFIHQDSLQRVDRSKGKFRNYLAGAIRNFLRNKRRSQAAIPIHVELEDDLEDPVTTSAAADDLDRTMALVMVKNAIDQMKRDLAGSQLEPYIAHLLPYLGANPPQETLRQVAARLGVSEDLVYQNRKRINKELRRQLEHEVSRHLGPEDDLKEEVREMLRLFAQGNT